MPSPDTTLTNSDARGTADKGLPAGAYPAETITYLYDEKKNVIGVDCDMFHELPKELVDLDKPETRNAYKLELEKQYRRLFAGLISYRYTGTGCLLRAAGSLHQLLGLVIALPDETKVPPVVDALLEIYQEIERRTREPYQYRITFNDQDRYRPLPKKILQEYPLNQCALWKQVKQRKWKPQAPPPVKRKPFTEDGLIPIVEKEQKPVNAEEMDKAIATAEAHIKINGELAKIPANDTPVVTLYRENLRMLTLDDVERQTKFRKREGDWNLLQLVDVIYYVTAHTLVLDKEGEPFDKNGIFGYFPYGMILPSRKFKTIKFAPPPGRYISLGPLADEQFEIYGGIVKKLSIQYHGILGYQEVDVTGSWTPDYQQKANEAMGKYGYYQGSVVVMSAFGPKDVGLLDIAGALPDVVEYTIPFFLKAMEKKVKEWFENAEDLLAEILKEALKNVIVETLKKIALEYVVKKIGKKVIPVVNAIAAIGDAVDAIRGKDDETETIAINCVRLHLQAINQDDKTYSSKILANIMSDKFEDELKSAITNHATKQGIKAVNKVKNKMTRPKIKPTVPTTPAADTKQDAPKGPATPPADTSKPAATQNPQTANKQTGDDAKKIEEGWKAFNETKKEQEKKEQEKKSQDKKTQADKQKERGTDKKETTAPATDTAPAKDKVQTPAATDDAKKKAERRAKIEAWAKAQKKKTQGDGKQTGGDNKQTNSRGTKGKGTKNKKTGTEPFDLKKALDDTEKKGKKSRMASVRRRSRKRALEDARRSLNEDAVPNARAQFVASRIRKKYGDDAVERFKRTGKLPHGFENSHLFSASEYPEFADDGDLTVITDHDDHIGGHHGGDTRDPLHGSPKIPSEDFEDKPGNDGDDNGDDDDE